MSASACDSQTLPPSFRARCRRFGEGLARPPAEPAGVGRIVPELVSVWFNLESPGRAVVAGDTGAPAVVQLPPGFSPLHCFGPALALAEKPCPECDGPELLLLGVRGGSRLGLRLRRGGDAAAEIPYHLAVELPEPPQRGLARPLGLVLGAVPGRLGVPVEVARLLWAGEDGLPLGWSRVPRALPDTSAPFEPDPGLGGGLRWLRIGSDRELLSASLAADFEALAVLRLQRAEGRALELLERI